MTERQLMLIAAGLGAGLLLWIYNRGVGQTAQDIGGAAVDAVEGVFVGSIEGVGKVFGIPPTNTTQCQQDINAGRKWEASFSCGSVDFFKGFW